MAQEAMIPYLTDQFADPSGEYQSARSVAQAIEDARTHLAQAIRAQPHEIVWTSCATESCNLALRGILDPGRHASALPHVVVSSLDHAAVQGPARYLATLGVELTVVPCNSDGLIDQKSVLDALQPNTQLVSIIHANDEIGSIQPIAEIAAACRDQAVLVHTDATQSFGKIPVSVETLGVDLLSLSSHKCYGPKGVGALYVRQGVSLEPLIHGGQQEGGIRSGMPNVAGIVGFGAAARLAASSLDESAARMADLRDRLSDKLCEAIPGSVVFGPTSRHRLPNTLCIALPGVVASNVLAAVPELSATACAGGELAYERISISSTLRAIGAEPMEASGAMRLSVGWYSDEQEIDTAAEALIEAWQMQV